MSQIQMALLALKFLFLENDRGRELILLLRLTANSFLLQAVWIYNTVLYSYIQQIILLHFYV